MKKGWIEEGIDKERERYKKGWIEEGGGLDESRGREGIVSRKKGKRTGGTEKTYSYVDMPVMPRMPMPSFYDMGYPGATRESLGSSFQAGDSKFGRDASSPVASTINTGNIHAAHAHQQAAFLGAAAAPTPYGYAYYPPNVIPAMFTAPPTQMQAGKAHMVGAHYQSGYTSQHSSPAYNSAGGSQEFGKGAYHQTASQTLQQTKSNQGSGSLGTTSLTSENSHHTGFKGPLEIQEIVNCDITHVSVQSRFKGLPADRHPTFDWDANAPGTKPHDYLHSVHDATPHHADAAGGSRQPGWFQSRQSGGAIRPTPWHYEHATSKTRHQRSTIPLFNLVRD
eukprot:gene5843-11162_t